MKKFAVSNVCNACGLCLIMTDLLVEDDTGHAQSAKKGYIHDEDMNRARTIVSQCPMKAISIGGADNFLDTLGANPKTLPIFHRALISQ